MDDKFSVIVDSWTEDNNPLLDSYEITVKDVEKIDDSLNGLRFVITGEIPGSERSDFEKMIVSHGGKCTLKISPATDFLIVGLFTAFPDGYESAKVQYAHKVISEGGKLKIINYTEFYSMFNLSSPEV